MSDEDGIVNGAKYSLNIRGVNESNKDLYYGIYLNQGEEVSGKVRFKDNEIKVYLTKTENENTEVVYGPGTLKDFNDKLIYADVINEKTNKDSEVNIDYELTIWIDENVLISDTIDNLEGRSIYTTEEFSNAYATVVPVVKGDFNEKNVNLNIKAEGTLKTSKQVYEINNNYQETTFTDENVIVLLSSEKEVSKFVITNAITKEVVEKIPTNNKSVEIEYQESGSFAYYAVYSDESTSEIDTYNIKIDKEIPKLEIESGSSINIVSGEYIEVENKIVIEEENDFDILYALVKKDNEVSEYNKVKLEDNKLKLNLKSGIWDLVVKVIDEAGKVKIERTTYTVSYNIDIVNNGKYELSRNIQKVVVGKNYTFIEELPVINDDDFIGYATDSKGINLINKDSIVSEGINKIYVIYKDIGLITEIPTSSLCNKIEYNGKSQILASNGIGYTLNNNEGINAGSYTITAKLSNGYIWSDETDNDKTFECKISKRQVVYTADSASKVYDGTALTKNSATLTSGSLISGHIASFTIEGSITEPGTVDNVLKDVIIKKGTEDVTSNYAITKKNGTLTITSISVEIPTASNYCNTGLTYTGSAQTLTKTAGTGYTFSGNSQTNAGTYTITATLASGYRWSDNTTGTKTFSCSIEKATPYDNFKCNSRYSSSRWNNDLH